MKTHPLSGTAREPNPQRPARPKVPSSRTATRKPRRGFRPQYGTGGDEDPFRPIIDALKLLRQAAVVTAGISIATAVRGGSVQLGAAFLLSGYVIEEADTIIRKLEGKP